MDNEITKVERRCQSFYFPDDTMIVHFIKTGFENRYMAVYEDPNEILIGKAVFGTKEEMEINFGIILSDD